ncbi:unnamed protein product [Orchesella dallaii]|uniref:C2H2-type domain-containing protein n=1 Tax=Orchesella dallaii TaxID=48710 RepID=A0ABP1S275_9HEXA
MKHLSSFTGVKGFNCELCGKGFFTNQSFESHFQTVHKDECTFTCSVCKMGFPQQDLLEGHHKSTHTPDSMPFKCKVCNSGFNMHKKLKAHMIIHIDNPTHVCLQCDKVYETKVDLRRHIKIHEDGKRRHVCQHCSARFFRKHHLERHVKRHERQDKIEEPLKNDFYQITQPQQQCHILTVNPQEIEANVNAQEIDGEVLKIQDTLETTITPVEADSKDPANNFGELAYDVVWIDSESFSTINAMDWNSLGGQRKHPEAVETASVLPAVSSRKYDNHIRTSENR